MIQLIKSFPTPIFCSTLSIFSSTQQLKSGFKGRVKRHLFLRKSLFGCLFISLRKEVINIPLSGCINLRKQTASLLFTHATYITMAIFLNGYWGSKYMSSCLLQWLRSLPSTSGVSLSRSLFDRFSIAWLAIARNLKFLLLQTEIRVYILYAGKT